MFPKLELFDQLAMDLEKKEIEGSSEVPMVEVHCQLLAIYLCNFDLCNAKLLWKRIPSDEKQANPILGLIWNVGQKLWQRDHYSVFSLLKKTEWPELVAPFMKSLEDSFRQRSLHLIEKAYISINTTAFANLSGYTDSPEDAEKLLTTLTQEQGWLFDTSSQLIIPKRSQNQVVPLMRHEDQLQSLTQLVSFLEN